MHEQVNGNGGLPVPRGNGQGELMVGGQRLVPAPVWGPAQGPPAEERDLLFDPWFVLAALRHWWFFAFAATIILATTSICLIWYFFKPLFRAGAVIQIADTTPFLAFDAGRASLAPEDFVQTQIELLRSRILLSPVSADPAVEELPVVQSQEDPVEWLMREIRVNRVGKSELYTVAMDTHDPEASALIVNKVVDSYFAMLDKDAIARSVRMVELLDEEKKRRAKDVAVLKERMRELSAKMPGQDVVAAIGGAPIIRDNPLGDLRDRLTEAEVERQFIQMQIKTMEEGLPEAKEVPEAALELAVDDSEEIRGLRAQIIAKRAMLPRIEAVASQGKEDASYRRVAREIEQLERTLQAATSEVKPRVAERMGAFSTLNRKEEIRSLKEKLTSQKSLESILRGRYEEQRAEYSGADNVALELEFLRAELEREEKVFQLIAERSTAFNTEMRAPGRVTLVEAASSPESPLERIPLKYMALALLGSMGLSCGSVVLLERSVRRIRDTSQLTAQRSLAVVGEIATLPMTARFGTGKISRRDPWGDSLYEESIDSLRTFLMCSPTTEGIQTLAVCSAVQGEGKTNLSARLAVSLARCSREPTLIIDADVRSPDIHRLFDVPRVPGLVEALSGRCSFQEAVVKNWSDQVPNLDVLPAGKLHMTPHELVGSYDLAGALTEFRKHYRFIILDTAPVLAASESLVIARHCDAAVLCALRNRSREPQVFMAFERLREMGARPLGVVLSAVPRHRYTSTYGSYPYRYKREAQA